MPKLKDILYKVNITSSSGDMDVAIQGISFDSRDIKKGYLFLAIKGLQYDGHDFIKKAIKNGAVAVVVEEMPELAVRDVPYVTVANSAKALGIIASNYYGNPSGQLKLIGVTGTNGKTTVVTLLYNLYIALGYKTGLLSTICNRIDREMIPTTHTTLDPLQINRSLLKMVEMGCSYCFMEVSSHAIMQGRIEGLHFSGGVFTNISHDHLDYHKTFENYIRAKKTFFDNLPSGAFALVNIDDKRGMVMLQNTKASKHTFAIKKPADNKAKIITSVLEGLELEIDNHDVWFKLIGDFNAYNLLAAYAVAKQLGENLEKTLTILSGLLGIPGRFELVRPGSKLSAIVDYSHTPDALENILVFIVRLKTDMEQIISIVGCGGDRDSMKRPLIAAVACKYSDKVIFTSDNPRWENAMKIIEDMKEGVSVAERKKTLVIIDREEAIKTACMIAKEKDIILVAGKGHEKFQEIKGVKYPFNDKEVLERMLKMFAD